jgi:signal transduction histidine kinase
VGDEKVLSDVDASLQEAMKELRTFGYLMHPPALRARRLRSTLRAYVDGFASRSDLFISFRSNPKVDKLPLPLQRSLFRIVQETLANVYRHASASHVSIHRRWIGDRLHLVITDDGRGLEDGSDHKGRPGLRPGTGMRGIKARLDAFAGELRIAGQTPNGTRLHAAIPVCDAARKAWVSGERRPDLTMKRRGIPH